MKRGHASSLVAAILLVGCPTGEGLAWSDGGTAGGPTTAQIAKEREAIRHDVASRVLTLKDPNPIAAWWEIARAETRHAMEDGKRTTRAAALLLEVAERAGAAGYAYDVHHVDRSLAALGFNGDARRSMLEESRRLLEKVTVAIDVLRRGKPDRFPSRSLANWVVATIALEDARRDGQPGVLVDSLQARVDAAQRKARGEWLELEALFASDVVVSTEAGFVATFAKSLADAAVLTELATKRPDADKKLVTCRGATIVEEVWPKPHVYFEFQNAQTEGLGMGGDPSFVVRAFLPRRPEVRGRLLVMVDDGAIVFLNGAPVLDTLHGTHSQHRRAILLPAELPNLSLLEVVGFDREWGLLVEILAEEYVPKGDAANLPAEIAVDDDSAWRATDLDLRVTQQLLKPARTTLPATVSGNPARK